MKKLLIASIVMLASITSCSNSNDEFVTTPVGKENVSSKITARDGSELTENEIKALQELKAVESNDDASREAAAAVERLVNGGNLTQKISTQIMCHGDYSKPGATWSYVQVTIDGEVYHRLTRRYNYGGGALTTVYRLDGPYDCNSILFW
jgi:hypothetical protein